jgi:hypothetical protein
MSDINARRLARINPHLMSEETPAPFVWRCVECAWTSGGESRPVPHPLRMGFICPQCHALGFVSRLAPVPLSEIRPVEEGR